MKTFTIGWLNKCRCGNKSHTVKTARGNETALWDDDTVKCNSCGRGGVIQVCEGQARVLWETDEEMAENKSISTITIDPRDAFEKAFPMPKHVIRCGNGYACTEYNAWGAHDFIRQWEGWSAAMLQGADGRPELRVWYGAMPETNGKTNWTAMLHRKCHHPWEGITIDRSEYPDRVRYEADRMRHLIGELADEPDFLAYDAEAHSGYVYPGNSPVIPDGWVACSERMPHIGVPVITCCGDVVQYAAYAWDGRTGTRNTISYLPTPLPTGTLGQQHRRRSNP